VSEEFHAEREGSTFVTLNDLLKTSDRAEAPGAIVKGGANTFLLIWFSVNFPVNKSTIQLWQYDS
jgi:hypothetical protein